MKWNGKQSWKKSIVEKKYIYSNNRIEINSSVASKSEMRGTGLLQTKMYNNYLSKMHHKFHNRIKVKYTKLFLQLKFGLIPYGCKCQTEINPKKWMI